ncbi:MAG: hypothetical protein ACYC3B_05340 [Sedimentisphaerales bacterium]
MKAYCNSPKSFAFVIVMYAVVIIGTGSIATAAAVENWIVVGTLPDWPPPVWTSQTRAGEVITVEEDNPGIQVNYYSYTTGWSWNIGGIRALSRGYVDPVYGPTIYVGLGWGYVDVRTPLTTGFTPPTTTCFAGLWNAPYYDGICTVGMKPNGDFLCGVGGGETVGGGEVYVYALDKANLTHGAPDMTGEYSNTTLRGVYGGLDITEIESISNDTIVVALNDQVYLADGYDMYDSASGGLVLTSEFSGVRGISFESRVNAMAVTPSGLVVSGLSSGYIDVRAMSDFGTVLASTTLPSKINELEILPNGNIVAGLANGDVKVLSVGLAVLDSNNFGGPIAGLAATVKGNVAIGTGNLLYVRSGNNLALDGDMSPGSAGVDMGNPIGALTAISLTPGNCGDAIALGYGLKTDLNGDCRTNFADFAMFMQQIWGRCMDPANANCEHPWE